MHDQRYAPPAAHVEDVEAPAVGPATRARRFWAAMLDTGIGVFALLLLEAVLPEAIWPGDSGEAWWTLQPADAARDFLLFLLLHGVLLLRRGQTIGKALLGIRIVRSDGGTPSAFQLLAVRHGLLYALMIVPGVGLFVVLVDSLLIFRSSRRCLHDTLADTIVVKA
ncbi:RDD family protein [Ramlibacter tataouinensis]|uniref:RDD domain-containing protein n=1 Tax=Ramlibacter tataouinensis (strain ATCC BAA-407 / DSM 14655 / LMG 21543 / TTB310) TaxID=365046 RepID=F5XXZ8_RAMTT|nr:RDD family protein [Ramlibacter tataouinensis]AEG94323.1 conserved hypothetical protein [Ramlibacter tataouinensis TTB310]